jgi:hypothetical protein
LILGPNQPSFFKGYWFFFPAVNQSGREVHHLRPSSSGG